MTLITTNCTQSSHRLKKVQGKKKRDTEKAEAAKMIEEAVGETDDEVKAKEEPSTGNLLTDRDEDVIF